MKIIAAVLVAALGLAGTAAADPMHRRAAARARFDINRDGRIDAPERIARRAYIYARLVRRFDLDRDGRLGPGEVPPRIAEKLRRFDRNGDGWIEPAEIIVPPSTRALRRAQGARSGRAGDRMPLAPPAQ